VLKVFNTSFIPVTFLNCKMYQNILKEGTAYVLHLLLWFIFSGSPAQCGPWPPHSRGFLITRRATVGMTPLDEWSARRRDLYLTTHTTNIHAPGGIQTHDHSRWAATDLRLRPCSHWDQHVLHLQICIFTSPHILIYTPGATFVAVIQ
jgi:hypothetical protein